MQQGTSARGTRTYVAPCRSDAEKQFRMTFLELSSEGDKQLAYANTTALRTVATEKCLWLKDR